MATSDPHHEKPGSWISADGLKHERELREAEIQRVWDSVVHLREESSARQISQDKALALQASEYERRLTALNHAHEQALEAQRSTVPRETFDNFRAEYDKWRAFTANELALAKGVAEGERLARQRQATNLAVGLTILSILIGVAMRLIQ